MALDLEKHAIVDEIKHELFHLYLRNDGIVQMNTFDEAFFTLKEAEEFVKALRKITKGVPHLILKVPGKHASVDSESRAYMATEDALRFSIAEAVIIRNVAQRMIGNFYLKFDKPNKPIHLFNEIDEAEKWLKTFQHTS